ncbi:MAG TPA: bifunctional riboflavin kinase/FAD synthetase [Deltaproteobacteria bacterium]|nr:MAG: riboflavin biosynthesis protein RibF [Deltaproteobacteria bacterium GWB2_42_7]OGP43308.1 MAG: riboflavin biosynthesis protein RibF [Deltaproteobacteria bacterium GWD2_42_10]OGP47909.1 MAG: riboflavin biosynthesis protein RibF [Deltaproteobacteria bacterium GWF2_42_12]OGQ69132.1 MAG: riboflavin biosynthesis protein RibF [Deltaproteobacteria bacterium RIFCSPLOWO2_12_FULL_42_16]HAG51751.1 bifunctional riboflavin kinase/FAD synthetase [Deltaproteobacteria bacterium]
MQVIRDIKKLKNIKPPIITLGNFDGVHIGHQQVLRAVKERSGQLKLPSIVYTFDPHPLKVVAPHKSPLLLTTPEEKIELLKKSGIDYLILARFTKDFASQHPRKFVADILVKQLNAKEIWVGHDYAFGKGRGGTIKYLKELGNELGFRVYVIHAYKKRGAIVSSSKIRKYLIEGTVKEAAAFLGRPYALSGKVVKGRNIGKHLGFPTANILVHNELIPKDGIYAVRVFLGKKIYKGAANIGFAPTFHTKRRAVEVHIIGFKGNIYGKKIKMEFEERLRGEKVFKSARELAIQIRKDVEKIKRIFK